MLLTEVARRWCHDRALRHNELPSRLNGEADVLLANEVERLGTIDSAISRLFSAWV